jgi:hypothetical protein
MRRGLLDVAQRDPGIEGRGYERVPERVGRDGFADARPAGDLADDPAGAVPVQPPSVRCEEYRTAGALADGQVDRPGSARAPAGWSPSCRPCG